MIQGRNITNLGLVPKKKVQPVAMIPTLDPSQQVLSEQLTGMLAGVQSPQKYLAGMSSFVGRQAPVGGGVQAALQRAMSGRVSEEYFQSTVAGPATRTFREDIAPTIRQGFVGPGTFWGGAQAEAVQKEGLRLTDAIAAARGEMSTRALDRAVQASLGYGELMSRNVSTWMQAYMKANPTYSETIQSIMQYLNIPTQLAYQDPEYVPSAIKKAMGTTSGWSARRG